MSNCLPTPPVMIGCSSSDYSNLYTSVLSTGVVSIVFGSLAASIGVFL